MQIDASKKSITPIRFGSEFFISEWYGKRSPIPSANPFSTAAKKKDDHQTVIILFKWLRGKDLNP